MRELEVEIEKMYPIHDPVAFVDWLAAKLYHNSVLELRKAVNRLTIGERRPKYIHTLLCELCWYFDGEPQQRWTESLREVCAMLDSDYDEVLKLTIQAPLTRRAMELYRTLVEEGKVQPVPILERAWSMYYEQ